ncbi:MAG: hypothetical protein NXI04_07355 [Planctomycetaceae bacterium]|nr:hypothetical protein [Planctomycetaceae bacterium]
MARDKPEEPGGGDIPAWFMTYSDVITLLMTFFILLMTFSTTEPENFGRMQVVMFGGGNSSGVARQQEYMEQNGMVVRVRPPSSRVAKDGSESPPQMLSPATKSVSKGIDALDQEEPVSKAERFEFSVPVSMLKRGDGTLSSYATTLSQMLGRQMLNVPVNVRFLAPSSAEAQTGLLMASAIYEGFSLAPGRLSVATVDKQQVSAGHVTIRLVRATTEEIF